MMEAIKYSKHVTDVDKGDHYVNLEVDEEGKMHFVCSVTLPDGSEQWFAIDYRYMGNAGIYVREDNEASFEARTWHREVDPAEET